MSLNLTELNAFMAKTNNIQAKHNQTACTRAILTGTAPVVGVAYFTGAEFDALLAGGYLTEKIAGTYDTDFTLPPSVD